MTFSICASSRCLLTAAALALLVPGHAQALTISGLKGHNLDSIYGSYAPRGNCAAEPRVTIDDKGFTFRVNGRTIIASKIEYAVSFMGPSYDGIASVFFPFPRSDDDFGPLIMTVNDGEKRGIIGFEADIGRGQRADPLHAALTAASPFSLCKGAGAARPAASAVPASPAGTPAPAISQRGTPWEVVQVQGGSPLAHVAAVGSRDIEALSLFCQGGRPLMAMLLNKPSRAPALSLSWTVADGIVTVPLSKGNREGTFWQASLTSSPLIAQLMRGQGMAALRLNGQLQGEASLSKAPVTLRTALRACMRL